MASFNSDYIIKYKEAFFDSRSSTLCIVMEFADAGDLEVPSQVIQKIIEKKKRTVSWMEEKEIWAMMRQVLIGLSALH